MSKRLLSAVLITTLGLAAAAPGNALAVDGTITFSGEVTAATCTINGGTGDFTVELPKIVGSTAFAAVGDTAGRKPFSIALTGCSGTGNVSAYFEPGSTINAAGRLANTAAGAASGVELQLLNDSAVAIDLNTQANTTVAAIDSTANTATLNYYVEYYATSASVGAGAVGSTVDYTIQYQ